MKMEDQVTSVEPAKELRELGVKQDSAFAWYQYKNYKPFVALKSILCEEAIPEEYNDGYTEAPKEICDAPTVAEHGEALKSYAHILPQWNKYGMGTKWFSDIYSPKGYCQVNEETEANARAKMRIYLIKEGLIEVEEIE